MEYVSDTLSNFFFILFFFLVLHIRLSEKVKVAKTVIEECPEEQP